MAELGDKRTWSNYLGRDFELDEQSNELSVSGKLYTLDSDTNQTEIEYTRDYRFLDDKIVIRIGVRANKNITLDKLYENIPVATCSTTDCLGSDSSFEGSNLKTNGSTIHINNQQHLADFDVNTNEVRLLSNNSKGMSIELEQDTKITGSGHGMRSKFEQVGWIEINLPTNLVAGEFVYKEYTINFL